MTGEEMERGIEFLLKSQANFEARQASYETRQASYEAQLLQTSQQVETLAKTQVEFAQFVRGFMEAQSEFNQSLRETVRALTINQVRTDERVSELERQ
jgi:4-aminobutyrate aminotransferase-like enzyme